MIYRFGTPEAISKALTESDSELRGPKISGACVFSEDLKSHAQCTETTLQLIESSKELPQIDGNILITGATGFFGCRLLCELLTLTDKIIACLVRCCSPEDGFERIKHALAQQAVEIDPSHVQRIQIVKGDVAEPRFSLSEEEYTSLSKSTSVVYHSAAIVNTVLPYEKLALVNVDGTRNVAHFCLQHNIKHLHYISTLSVFVGSDRKLDLAMESDNLSDSCHLFGGYTQSKWVAEKLLWNALRQGMKHIIIYRVGLITGDLLHGKMKETDIINAVIRTITRTGRVPIESNTGANLMAFDLTPVDYAAKAVSLISTSHQHDPPVYHIAGREPVTLSRLSSLLEECGFKIERVPKELWQEQVSTRDLLAFVGMSRALGSKNSELTKTMDIFQTTGIRFNQTNTQSKLKDRLSSPIVDASLLRKYSTASYSTEF